MPGDSLNQLQDMAKVLGVKVCVKCKKPKGKSSIKENMSFCNSCLKDIEETKTCSACCKDKNISEYIKKSGKCRKCRSIYNKEYREKNKKKLCLKSKEYYQKNKDKIKKYQKNYNNENREKVFNRKKEYYKKNKERLNRLAKERYQQNEKIREYKREWEAKNKDKRNKKIKEKYKINKESFLERSKKYLKNSIINLNDSYIRKLLSRQCGAIDDIPQELIDLKRSQLQLYRAVKQQEKQNEEISKSN